MTLEELFVKASHGCQDPLCTDPHTDLIMHPKCHLGAPTFLVVNSKERTMKLVCSECDEEVMSIECPLN